MTRTLRAWLVVLLAIVATACGKDSAATDPGIAQTQVRALLADLIDAGIKDDINRAAPHLALQEYAVTLSQGKPPNIATMPAAEREELTKACFTQLKSLVKNTTIKDTAAINASLQGAAFKLLPKLSRGEVLFYAIRSDKRGGQSQWKATLFLHHDGQWRLCTLEEQFNR